MTPGTQASQRDAHSILELVRSIPLDRQRVRIVAKHGLTDEEAEKWLDEYRKWVALRRCFEGAYMVPTAVVDEVWHEHIVDTRRYTDFCERVFGRYLHHEPIIDPSENQSKSAKQAFTFTKQMWAKCFGSDPMRSEMADCSETNSPCQG